ncbi:hypothetical protein BV25DRAFT_1908449 [Artomyces pyxidatus]|uniref:Uncharacterized protein n=1 Tax=Artomyces pyxidatus TaxID=48021 RepID=A0ACB8SWA9_9AGAM|nr:hypothetical protein BV25DRAFT_1908449 [Artomyces pyxidatus]
MITAQQAQAEGLCLRFPENLPLHATLTHEVAVTMLTRAIQLSGQVPYQWAYIDKPPDGQLCLLFIPAQFSFPPDGIRFLEQEQRYAIPIAGGRELEVIEARYGFVPNSPETTASRVRRRYRLSKGGHAQLVLVHYSRGSAVPIPPALHAQPVRAYPLRPITEPAMFVMGEKTGQKVPIGPPNATAQLTAQSRDMEALERRAAREREASMSQRAPPPPPVRLDEEDPADDLDFISTRALALTRYKRNHELMSAVFMHAAFGERSAPPPPKPYSIFDKTALDENIVKLTQEIEDLRAKAAAREAQRAEI